MDASENIQDPFDWAVDDVVKFFCYNDHWWQTERPSFSLTNRVQFEEILRGEEIDGLSLLAHIQDDDLRTYLGLKAIGKRASILWAINKLRGESPKYIATTMPNAHLQQQPYIAAKSPTGYLNNTILSSRASHDVSHQTPSLPGEIPILDPRPSHSPTAVVYGQAGLAKSGSPFQSDTPFLNSSNGNTTAATNGISNNEFTQYSNNSISRTQSDSSINEPYPNSTVLHFTPSPPPTRSAVPVSEKTKDKRRLAPTALPPQIDGHKNAFFRRSKLSVDEIFYGRTRLGQHLHVDIDPDDLDFDFIVHNRSGESRYVYGRMLHFLNNAKQEDVVRDSGTGLAIFPYQEELASGTYSAMLFHQDGRSIAAIRADSTRLSSTLHYDNQEAHEWDFLNHWSKMTDDKEIPVDGGSVTSEITSPSLRAEIEDEQKEREQRAAKRNRPLASEEVRQIIREAISKIRAEWQETKLPRKEKVAWTEWKKARSSYKRKVMLQNAISRMEELNQRLEKYIREISQDSWHKEDDLTKQCEILGVTIQEQEDLEWRMRTWRRKTEPPRVKRISLKKKARPVYDSDASEDIESFSDEEEATMSDFVINDTFQMLSPSLGENDIRPSTASSKYFDVDNDQGSSSNLGTSSKVNGSNTCSNPKSSYDETEQAAQKSDNFVQRQSPSVVGSVHSPGEPSIGISTPMKHRPGSFRGRFNLPADIEIVDLTGSLPSTPIKPKRTKAIDLLRPDNVMNNTNLQSSSPNDGDSDLSIGGLEERQDRMRLTKKMIKMLSQQDLDNLKSFLSQKKLSEKQVADDIARLLGYLSRGEGIEGFPPSIALLSKLWICWEDCTSKALTTDFPITYYKQFLTHGFSNAKIRVCLKFIKKQLGLSYKGKEKENKDEAMGVEESVTPGKPPKSPKVIDLLPTRDKRKSPGDSAGSAEDRGQSDEDTPRTKRKKKVAMDRAAMEKRTQARLRQQEQRSSQLFFDDISGSQEDRERIAINLGGDRDIYINHHIGRSIKQHQVDGVRFLWREVVEAKEGCLLSHTMGLGKTMQAITLLVTLSEATNSADSDIRRQVPTMLRKSRTLVLCPAALVSNWEAEFERWAPRHSGIGQVRTLVGKVDRELSISTWYDQGGVLILSYDLFTQLLKPESKACLKKDFAKKHLLDGPNVVVADEAHYLKNHSSGRAIVAGKFKTKSRVALTGSPLSNNLLEYYAMIDWISPNYLGPLQEFKAHYQEPIIEGLYTDSAPLQRRHAWTRLTALREEIDPKVHRAGYDALKGQLPGKVEFIITVDLTDIQKQAYTEFVDSVKGSEKWSNTSLTRLFDWLGLLSLLCNHPKLFLDKLAEREKAQQAKQDPIGNKVDLQGDVLPHRDSASTLDEDDVQNATFGERPLAEIGVNKGMIDAQQLIFKDVGDVNAPEHSSKIDIFLRILQLARRARDKVLVFSHSLATLAFLKDLVGQAGHRYALMTGSIPAAKRVQDVKTFNAMEGSAVYLISTKAGGVGLNIMGANRVVIFDYQFNPTWEEQAVGRAYRIGQNKRVYVYRFISGGTYESVVHLRAVFKQQLATRTVDKKNIKAKTSKMQASELLFKPYSVEQEDLAEYLGNDEMILDQIITSPLSEHIRSIATTETLREEEKVDLTAEELLEIKAFKEQQRRLRLNVPPALTSNMPLPYPIPGGHINLTHTAPNRPPMSFQGAPHMAPTSSTQPERIFNVAPSPASSTAPPLRTAAMTPRLLERGFIVDPDGNISQVNAR